MDDTSILILAVAAVIGAAVLWRPKPDPATQAFLQWFDNECVPTCHGRGMQATIVDKNAHRFSVTMVHYPAGSTSMTSTWTPAGFPIVIYHAVRPHRAPIPGEPAVVQQIIRRKAENAREPDHRQLLSRLLDVLVEIDGTVM
jgi:hypothetical protein